MKVLILLEAGIPEYRNFLLERLSNEYSISELLILHNGRIYNGRGNYNSKVLRFIGSQKFGVHIGLLKYIYKYDVVVSSYNLRILSCWIPVFFKKRWIFWGKGLGSNESKLVLLLRKLTSRRASKILVYNDIKKKELISKTNVSSDKVVAYQNTIFISNPGYKDTERTYFTYFGRIQDRKGLYDLVIHYSYYLLERLETGRSIHKLKFVGNGDYKEVLIDLVSELNIESYVEFYQGVYGDEEIKKHFENTIAYFSPYNVGLAVINSFSYGVPVVTCAKIQVGPEFYYLDNKNSFTIDDIRDIQETMSNISDLDLTEMREYCYNYYLNNLHSDIMYNNFFNAIKEAYYE